ncbi:MAG: DUF1273 family protein [Clostridia bacterium]|nr:DUF1273 family protein [Clostridia bacterium]
MMTEMEIKPACAFTGHRPQRFSFGYDETHPDCLRLKEALAQQIELLYLGGMRRFYTGCAQGVDMWAGEAVMELARTRSDAELCCAVPFAGHELGWSAPLQRRYRDMLRAASEVKVLRESFTPDCYHVRNRWLVDSSHMLLAVYDGSAARSGTGYTVNYARRLGRNIVCIRPDTLEIVSY